MTMTSLSMFRPALVILLCGTALFGFAYPLVVTGIAQTLFAEQAHGSIVSQGGKAVGSTFIGQQFTSPKYFHGRPSATTPPYNAAASGASNLGPSNPDLRKAVQARVLELHQADPGNNKLIPAELVEASASGLDPEISPEAAEYQVARVAAARNMDAAKLRSLVAAHTRGPQFGMLGMARVNVLELNLALDGK